MRLPQLPSLSRWIQPVQFSDSGRPTLDADEVELAMQTGVKVYARNSATGLTNGLLVITSKRMIWMEQPAAPGGYAFCLSLCLVGDPATTHVTLHKNAMFSRSSAKVQVQLTALDALVGPGRDGPAIEFYQNERHFLLGGWSRPALPTDRSAFSSESGLSSLSDWNAVLPKGNGGWARIMKTAVVSPDFVLDRSGRPDGSLPHQAECWEYANDWRHKFHSGAPARTDVVRRRRMLVCMPSAGLDPSKLLQQALASAAAASAAASAGGGGGGGGGRGGGGGGGSPLPSQTTTFLPEFSYTNATCAPPFLLLSFQSGGERRILEIIQQAATKAKAAAAQAASSSASVDTLRGGGGRAGGVGGSSSSSATTSSSSSSSAAASGPPRAWSCPTCTFLNPDTGLTLACHVCGGERPSDAHRHGQGSQGMSGGGAGAAAGGGNHSALTQQQTNLAQAAVSTTSKAGIGGLRRQALQKEQRRTDSVNVAFQDLASLMEHARTMVALSDDLAASQASTGGGGGGGGSGGEDASERDLAAALVSMGISNPVTKQTFAGHGQEDVYFDQLGREISDFVSSAGLGRKEQGVTDLARSGMITLTDLYCMINRARGTALLSPDDLLQGCKHLSASTADKSSHSGAAQWGLYTFPSGVIVLKSAALAEELLSATESLYALLDSCGGSVTELDVSRKYSVSLQLAAELLTLWEAGPRLLLCRDETMDGTRFHRNFFLTAFAY